MIMIPLQNKIRRKLGWSVSDAYAPIWLVYFRRILGCDHKNAMDLGDSDHIYWYCFDCERKLGHKMHFKSHIKMKSVGSK